MPVFDQGYQHWSGRLSGHRWRWLAITRHGVRVALGNRWLRMALITSWLPALLLASMLCVWGLVERQSELFQTIAPFLSFLDEEVLLDPYAHRVEIWTLSYSYFMRTELYFSMLLILIVGPNLISQDLRYNALPLYFSRPLRRFDYFLGKWGVIFTFLAAVTILPAIAAYVLGLLFSLDLSIIRQTLPILLASVAYGFLISASAGTFILALSSLSRNSRYVALFWLAVWLGSGAVAGVLMEIDYENRQHAAWRAGQGPFLSEGAELQAAQFDWRPTVSYATNLARLGEEMLGTANAWNKLAELVGNQSYRLKTAQYPWTWSLGVLAGLFGLSACILHLSIKSLDRLK